MAFLNPSGFLAAGHRTGLGLGHHECLGHFDKNDVIRRFGNVVHHSVFYVSKSPEGRPGIEMGVCQ